jgi:hypothetical protein
VIGVVFVAVGLVKVIIAVKEGIENQEESLHFWILGEFLLAALRDDAAIVWVRLVSVWAEGPFDLTILDFLEIVRAIRADVTFSTTVVAFSI